MPKSYATERSEVGLAHFEVKKEGREEGKRKRIGTVVSRTVVGGFAG
jgi:hypothetical protein